MIEGWPKKIQAAQRQPTYWIQGKEVPTELQRLKKIVMEYQ